MRVLIADDDPFARRVMQHALQQWGYEVIAVEDGTAAWNVLREPNAPPLAILDWVMPGLDGVDLCRLIRANGDASFTYVVLLTGRSTKQDVVNGIASGADDFIAKPFDPHELQVRLRTGRRIVEMQRALLEQATRDALTRLWNRRSIESILDKELARSVRSAASVGVLVVDIDHFKQLNDTHGHAAGDVALREVSALFEGVLRPSDSVGRYGGEEFLIVLPDCELAGALATAERVRETVAGCKLRLAERSVSVTVSIGAAVTGGQCIESAELIALADAALYRAKRNGRNRVEAGGAAVVDVANYLSVGQTCC
jgi:two-component system, cell cycle response regulator